MNTRTRYSTISMALHWAMLLLIVAVYCLMEFRGIFPKGSDGREAMKHWHYVLGLTIFALVWLRIVARVVTGVPPITPAPSRIQHLAATAMHGLLYLLMIGMPLGGWTILSAENQAVPFYGWTLPPLVAPDESLAHLVEEIHETFGTIGYGLLAVHAAAALYHHFFLRDDTLRRMLPHGHGDQRASNSTNT